MRITFVLQIRERDFRDPFVGSVRIVRPRSTRNRSRGEIVCRAIEHRDRRALTNSKRGVVRSMKGFNSLLRAGRTGLSAERYLRGFNATENRECFVTRPVGSPFCVDSNDSPSCGQIV